MLPTRTISETMVASCTASGSNVSDACSDLCFIRCKSKPEAATTIANILYLSLSSNKSVRSVHFVLCGLMSFKRERARGVSLFLSLLCVCVCESLFSHTLVRDCVFYLSRGNFFDVCVCACVCVCVFILMFSFECARVGLFPKRRTREERFF
jgi:hypothetical protein